MSLQGSPCPAPEQPAPEPEPSKEQSQSSPAWVADVLILGGVWGLGVWGVVLGGFGFERLVITGLRV